MKNKNVLRVGIAGGEFKNKGAEAMLLTTAASFRENFPNVEIYAWVVSPEFTEARSHHLIPVRRHTGKSAQRSLFNRLAGKASSLLLYSRLHAIVDVGGYQFGDPWGPAKKLQDRTMVLKILKRLGTRLFYLPQAWGPFELPGMRSAIRDVIENCEVAYVRDRVSLAEVVKAVGLDHPHVRSAPDIAWNFPVGDRAFARQILAELGIRPNAECPTICLTPNLRVYERAAGTGLDNQYLKALVGMIHHFTSVWGGKVLLLGHEMLPDNSRVMDDRSLCELLLSSFSKNPSVVHLNQYLPAAVIKAVIGECQFVVSSRFHCLIAGLSQGIPSAAVGWSHKYDELMAEVGLAGNVLSWSDDWTSVAAKLDKLWQGRDEQARILERSVPGLKRRAGASLENVVSMLK